MKTWVVDSGGISRTVKTLWVVDSSSISRRIKKAFVIDSGGIARLAYVAAAVIPTTVNGSSTLPASAEALITFTTAGTEVATSNAFPGGAIVGNWLPGGSTSGYQIMATLNSGTAPNFPGATNTLGTWLTATSNLSWGLQRTTNGTETCSLLIQVRAIGSGVLASGNITLMVNASP
jgi:hypothetical protein